MYTIEPKKLIVSFTKDELMEQLERLTAKTAETLATPQDIAIAPDLYCITPDDKDVVTDLLRQALDLLLPWCGKNGNCEQTDEKVTISVGKTLYLDRNAPLVEIRLRNLLVRRTMTLWYELRGMKEEAKRQNEITEGMMSSI